MQTIIKAMILMLASLVAACGNDQAPKAKSANTGDALAADAETEADSDQSGGEQGPINASEKTESSEDDKGAKDKEEEDEELDEDEDDGKKGSALTFKSTNRDDNDFSLAIRVGKKSWTQQAWPDSGDSVEFPGVCKGKKVSIEVKVVNEDGTEITKGTQLAVNADGAKATVAFEQNAGGDAPDDLVGEISCSKAKLSIK